LLHQPLSLFLRINVFACYSLQALDSRKVRHSNLFLVNPLPLRCI
jgi:hypothetical protein